MILNVKNLHHSYGDIEALHNLKFSIDNNSIVSVLGPSGCGKTTLIRVEDRAVTKNDGSPTYFANDVAYHVDKHKRGFDKLINIWGADHHGYIPRMNSLIKAIKDEVINTEKAMLNSKE